MSSSLWPVVEVSLKVAFYATLIVMGISTLLGLVIVKYPSKLLRTLELLIYMPMAMPPIALGYGLLVLLGPNSSFGLWLHKSFAIDIAFTPLGAILAAVMVSLGIGLRAMRVAFEGIDPAHQHRALLMGAHPWQIFRYITFPLCRRALVGAAILVFIRSLGEFGATMVLAGNSLGSTRTLALAIWTDMQTPEHETQVFLLVMVSILISIAALVSSEMLLRKGNRD